MTTEIQPPFEKLKKLLALSRSTANEHESSAAADKFQEIMQAFGLELHQIEAKTGEHGTRAKKITDRRALYVWQRDLMGTLATTNFCFHNIETVQSADDGRAMRKSKRHSLIGRAHNVELALELYDYLCEAIRRAATSHGFDHATNEKQHHIFLDGATARICQRLRDQAEDAREKSKAERGDGTSLVLQDVYTVEQEENEDIRCGLPIGSHTKARMEAQALNAKRTADAKLLIEQGIDKTVAAYMVAYECDQASAEQKIRNVEIRRREAEEMMAKAANKPETEIQARKRRERAKRDEERQYMTTAKERADSEKYASDAFRKGVKAGDSIGLDKQVGSETRKEIE